MRKKAALVLGMAITFSQVAMAEEITSSTEQIENCTPETSVQEENFQETEQQSNVNEVQESVSEDEEVQTQESTIESSEVESEIASELDSTVEESTSELDTTSASEVDNDLLQKMYEYAQIYNDANGAPEGDSLACEQYAALEQYPDNGIMVINNNEISVSAYISKLLSKVGKGYSQANRDSADYFDCSSLVKRCFSELGITNVPGTTVGWNSALSSVPVNGEYVLSGSGGMIRYKLIATNVTELSNPDLFSVPGTIMVYIAPGASKGHVAVSLGSFARQNGNYNPNSQSNLIVQQTKNYVVNQLQQRYGIAGLGGTSSMTGRDKLYINSNYLGQDMNLGNNTYSGPYNSIFRVEAASPTFGVCVNNSVSGLSGMNVKYVLRPVQGGSTAAAPTLGDVKVTELTSKGYRVTATFSAPAGVKSVKMPTWTEKNGQDDLIWHEASISGNTATFYVPVSSHNNESGTYNTHVYVYDVLGRETLKGVTVTVPAVSEAPKILNIKTEDLTAKGYRVTVTFSAPAGVKEVQMPTWTAKNDQDDIVWHIASISGNTATFYVPVSSHNNESGVYYTHVYVYDVNGAYALEGITVRVPAVAEAPVIKKIETSNVTTAGYTVKVTFSAQLGVKEVKMPTWTEKNGQDDIVWHVANISGNTATAYIPTSAHNNEVGNYITHVYVVDKKNNEAVEAVYVTVK